MRADQRELLEDTTLAVGLAVLGIVAVYGADQGGSPYGNPGGLITATPIGVAVVVMAMVPVAVRRRWPLPALLASEAAYAVTAFTDGFDRLPVLVAVLVCLYAFAARVDAGTTARMVGAVTTVVVAALSVTFGLRWHGPDDLLEWVRDGGLEIVGFVGAWVLGSATERREESRRTLAVRATLAEDHAVEATTRERQRIARELHDLVGHAISVISVQATVGEHLAESDPPKAREALATIHTMSTQAMAEMRQLVGVLRDDSAGEPTLTPQPGLSDIEVLVDEVRRAGTVVEVATEGEVVTLSPGVGLAAYRVVQESLNNARKHAPGAPVRVAIRYLPAGLELEITNDAPPEGGPPLLGATVEELGSSGFGLLSMRERMAVYHGSLEAAPGPTGGFTVRARLPYDPDSRPTEAPT